LPDDPDAAHQRADKNPEHAAGGIADEDALKTDADVAEQRVSAEIPLGRALLGRRLSEEVRFRAPGGILTVTIVAVRELESEPDVVSAPRGET